jgi:hypothetical protein
MRSFAGAALLSLLLAAGCGLNYDVAEVAPEEHLGEDPCVHDHHDHSCGHDHDHDHEECHPQELGPSGHSHAPGDRNHGTEWLFNQPWAARFFWGKLTRDASIFLGLAVILFIASGKRRRS